MTKFVRGPFCSPVLARNICLETFLENSCNVLVVTVLSSGYGAAAQCRTQQEEEEEETLYLYVSEVVLISVRMERCRFLLYVNEVYTRGDWLQNRLSGLRLISIFAQLSALI